MKQKIITLLTSICLVFLFLLPAHAVAAEQITSEEFDFVFDNASLLSDSEFEHLETFAITIYTASGCGIYIITVDSFAELGSSSVYDCATELFTSYGLGFGTESDGVLLLLSMEDRDFAFISHGSFANSAFPDYIKANIEEKFLDDFAKDDWFEGFKDYLEECRDSLIDYINGTPSDYNDYENDSPVIIGPAQSGITITHRNSPVTWFVVIFVPLLIAFIICSIFKSQMKTAVKKTEAHDYIVAENIEMLVRQDIFTHRTETRRVIESNSGHRSAGHGGGHRSSSGGGRSGFSGRSGKF